MLDVGVARGEAARALEVEHGAARLPGLEVRRAEGELEGGARPARFGDAFVRRRRPAIVALGVEPGAERVERVGVGLHWGLHREQKGEREE